MLNSPRFHNYFIPQRHWHVDFDSRLTPKLRFCCLFTNVWTISIYIYVYRHDIFTTVWKIKYLLSVFRATLVWQAYLWRISWTRYQCKIFFVVEISLKQFQKQWTTGTIETKNGVKLGKSETIMTWMFFETDTVSWPFFQLLGTHLEIILMWKSKIDKSFYIKKKRKKNLSVARLSKVLLFILFTKTWHFRKNESYTLFPVVRE